MAETSLYNRAKPLIICAVWPNPSSTKRSVYLHVFTIPDTRIQFKNRRESSLASLDSSRHVRSGIPRICHAICTKVRLLCAAPEGAPVSATDPLVPILVGQPEGSEAMHRDSGK